MALTKRRNNYTQHDQATMDYLVHFNDWVGLYLWYGLIGITGIVTFLHWTLKLQGYFRRRDAGFRSEAKRLPRTQSIRSSPATPSGLSRVSTRIGSLPLSAARNEGSGITAESGRGLIVLKDQRKMSVRFGWYWLAAVWRKYSIKHSKIAEFFFLGDLGQLFLITVYFLLNFLLIGLGTAGDIDWMAHHAAKLTYANLPLIIGLAGKNNVLSKLTGFAYESLNVLHRWSARFVIISSAIHIGGRIYINQPRTGVGRSGSGYIAWGWVAFALFIYMIVMASRTIRNRAYQFFLIQHLTLWFVIVAALVIHRPQLQGWIWAGFALHLLDRVARGARIAYYHLLRRVEDDDDDPKGTVTVLTEDTIRVSVRTKQNWIAGQHVYLHCPKQSPGGHPFTISNTSRPLNQADMSRPEESTQELIIRVREGMTRKVFEVGNQSKDDETIVEGKSNGYPKVPVPIKAWTEGPYGHEKHLGEDYNTLMLIAGGSGVSYTLSNSMDLVRRARAMHIGSESKTIAIATKRLSFVWMVKKPEQVAWIADHLKDMCLASPPGFMNITIFVTSKRSRNEIDILPGFVTNDRRDPVPEPEANEKQPSPRHQDSTDTSQSDVARKVDHNAVVELRSGRPDFKELVQREMDASAYSDWVGIGACGPTPMNGSIATAVSEAVRPAAVLRGELRRNIYLTIEEFGW